MLAVSGLDAIIGRRSSVLLTYFITLTGLGFLWLLRIEPSVWLLGGFIVCCGATLGSRSPLISATAMHLFRGRAAATIFGCISIGAGAGQAIGAWIGGLLHDWTGGYDAVIGFSVVSLLLGHRSSRCGHCADNRRADDGYWPIASVLGCRFRAAVGGVSGHRLTHLPRQGWPNWPLGNHDRPRIPSRVGVRQAPVAAMLGRQLRQGAPGSRDPAPGQHGWLHQRFSPSDAGAALDRPLAFLFVTRHPGESEGGRSPVGAGEVTADAQPS
jgi:MFS family permease